MASPQQPGLPDPPNQLKVVQSYMRVAQDVDRIDPIIGYWLRLYSTETALKIDKDSTESKSFLVNLLSWLEKFKQSYKDNETVYNQTVGQAHYENFAMALFNKVDTLDRAGTANKNTVRMFFMASVLFEAMAVFGPLTEEISQRAKYAKFKAAYIQRCLKTGQSPKPGPIEGADLEGDGSASTDNASGSNFQADAPVPPANPTISQMPSPGGNIDPISDLTKAPGGLYIPEVPKDPNDNSTPAAALIPPRPTDPFVLTPTEPPLRPTQSKPIDPGTSQDSHGKSSIADARFAATNGAPLGPEDIVQGQKYCKFANSALQYDDIPTAVANLQKALKLLTTGRNSL